MNKAPSLFQLLKQEFIDDFSELIKNFKANTTTQNIINNSKEAKEQPYQERSILELFPYRSFYSKYNIFESNNTHGFILRVSHFTGINEQTKNSLKNLINDFPDDLTVQIINYASPRIGNILDYWFESGNNKAIYKKITEKRLKFFQNGSLQSILGTKQNLLIRNYELYFCFSIPTAITESGREENLLRLKALQEKTIEGFRSIDSEAVILDDKDLVEMLKEILNPSTSIYKEYITHKETSITNYFRSDLNIEMCHDRVKFKRFSSNELNHQYITFEITDFPEVWDLENSIDYIGQFFNATSISCPFYISYGFTLKDSKESERTANKYRMIKLKQGDSKLLMFFPRMLDEINDWRYVGERVNQGERLGKIVMYVTLLAPSRELADKSISMITDHFARLKFKIEQVKYDTVNSFLHTLPFGIAENWQILNQLKIPATTLSGAVMNLMPVFADMQNYSNPLMLFVGRRGQVFFFDNFKTADNINGNFNMIIVGNSGRGKSVWMQEYTTAILRNNGQVIIIDDGRSFKNTAELFDGDFVNFGGGDFCINPFSLYREKSGTEENDEYKEYFTEPFIDLIVSILCIVINIDKNNNFDIQVGKYRAVLENAVESVMNTKGSNGGFNDIRNELLFNNKVRTPQTTQICDDIEYILRKYSQDGRYEKYFNGPSTLNITNDFTVFELSDLQHNLILQNAVLMTVVFLVYAKMQGRDRRTALMIDEFWRLGSHPALKEPIEGFARRGRKYNLSLILASQCMSDFSHTNSPAGAAALAQSDWRIMLSVDGKDEGMLKAELKMSPAEIEIANNLSGLKGAYSEFMIRHKNNSWQIGRLLLDPFSAKLYSTKAEDVAAVKKMKSEGLKTEEAIERLLLS